MDVGFTRFACFSEIHPISPWWQQFLAGYESYLLNSAIVRFDSKTEEIVLLSEEFSSNKTMSVSEFRLNWLFLRGGFSFPSSCVASGEASGSGTGIASTSVV